MCIFMTEPAKRYEGKFVFIIVFVNCVWMCHIWLNSTNFFDFDTYDILTKKSFFGWHTKIFCSCCLLSFFFVPKARESKINKVLKMLNCWNESVEQETQFSDLIWYNNNKKKKNNNVSLSNYFESIIAAIHRTSVFDNFDCCKNKGANILPVCVCSEYEPLEWLEYFFFLLSFNFEYIFTFCVWFFIILRAINSWTKICVHAFI